MHGNNSISKLAESSASLAKRGYAWQVYAGQFTDDSQLSLFCILSH